MLITRQGQGTLDTLGEGPLVRMRARGKFDVRLASQSTLRAAE